MSRKRQSRKSRRQQSDVATSSGRRGRRAATAEEFNPDYSQTIKDLKRIGALASTFFVILVALSFFLR
jgi:hypothetical protein